MPNEKSDFLESLFKQGAALKIITAALTSTVRSYTKVPAQCGKPFLRKGSHQQKIAVAGLIRFEGQDFSLELFLGFSKEIFLNLYESMFQAAETEISEENQDLAGEILNIAFGAMDPEFRKKGFSFRSSFPIVYSGEKLDEILANLQATAIVIPYTCGNQRFYVEVYAIDSLIQNWKFEQPKSA